VSVKGQMHYRSFFKAYSTNESNTVCLGLNPTTLETKTKQNS